jgi:hypothetical protein
LAGKREKTPTEVGAYSADMAEHEHSQVEITTRYGSMEVDEGIAPLIVALHEAHVPTDLSCEHQEHRFYGDVAWVSVSLQAMYGLNQAAYELHVEHYAEHDFPDDDFPDLYMFLKGCKWDVNESINSPSPDGIVFYSLNLRFDREDVDYFAALVGIFELGEDED